MTRREAIDALVVPGAIGWVERLRQRAERGPVNWYHVQMLKIYAKWGLPGARELLEKCPLNHLKGKSFAEI